MPVFKIFFFFQIAGSVSSTGDVYFVPAFTGLYAPYWRKDARGYVVSWVVRNWNELT